MMALAGNFWDNGVSAPSVQLSLP